jgi:DNA-binding Lrp family transcriptional regulator
MTKKRLSKAELEAGLANGQITYKDPKTKHRKGYEVRIASGNDSGDSYPSFRDHPSPEGTIEYAKHVDTSGLATVWEAVANEHYANGGIPRWVHESLTPLHLSVYWQMAHYQRVFEGRANMSLKTLSRNLGVKYRSVQRSVRKLLEIGAIEQIQKNSGRRPAAYQVRLLSSLENPFTVEATHQNVEATSENRRGDPSVVHKTKPLKGRVARSTADADRATPREKKSPLLRTIDEDRTFRTKQRAKQERASKPQLIRAFFPVEVRKEKIAEVLELKSLAEKWEAVKEMAKVTGGVDLESETYIPAIESDDAKLLEFVQARLLLARFDVTNLAKALDWVLDSYLKENSLVKEEFERKLKNTRDQREREAGRQAAREKEEAERRENLEREEAERLLQRQRDRVETFEYLERARDFLLTVFPNLLERIDGWGSVTSFLYELNGGKEANRIENVKLRSQLYDLSKAIPTKLLELHGLDPTRDALAFSDTERKLESWIEGGEEWQKLRFS